MNVEQKSETGIPAVSIRWPKNVAVQTEVVESSDGRFICQIKVNDSQFCLPGTHPTRQDAERTLEAYILANQ